LNLIWLGIVCGGIRKFMKYLEYLLQGMLTLKMKIDRPIHVDKLNEFLLEQKIRAYDINVEENNIMRKAVWEEKTKSQWGGARPKISLLYDEQNNFLWEVFFTVDTKRTNFNEKDLLETFIKKFEDLEIWRKDDIDTEDMMEGILEDKEKIEEEGDGDKEQKADNDKDGEKDKAEDAKGKSGKDDKDDTPAKPA